MSRTALIQWYYRSSPLLFVLGWWWGIEVRAVFLPDLNARFGYYVFLSALGLLAHFRPSTAPFVALGESSLNLLLLLLWILIPIWDLTSAVETGDLVLPYTVGEVLVNGLLAGAFCLLGFYGSQLRIVERFSGSGR